MSLGEGVFSGEHNGLTVLLDVEAFDHGFNPATGTGVYLVVNHHGDKPILSSGRVDLQPGTDATVQVVPSFITTTEAAIKQFSPEQRNCYTCNEVKRHNVTILRL